MRCRRARPWGCCSWDLISSIWWRINRTQFLALVKGQHHKYFLSPAPFILHFCYLLLFGSNGPRLVRSHTLSESFYSQNLILPMITLKPITPRTWSYNTVSFSGSITTSRPSYHHLLHFRTSQEVRLRVSISCLLACNQDPVLSDIFMSLRFIQISHITVYLQVLRSITVYVEENVV